MVTESLAGRLEVRENFTLRIKPISASISERFGMTLNRFIEYPSSPSRYASTPNNWMLPDWIDYQLQKMVQGRKS